MTLCLLPQWGDAGAVSAGADPADHAAQLAEEQAGGGRALLQVRGRGVRAGVGVRCSGVTSTWACFDFEEQSRLSCDPVFSVSLAFVLIYPKHVLFVVLCCGLHGIPCMVVRMSVLHTTVVNTVFFY